MLKITIRLFSKRVLKGTILCLLVLVVFAMVLLSKPKYHIYSKKDLKGDIKILVDSFYLKDEKLISKGKIFDAKMDRYINDSDFQVLFIFKTDDKIERLEFSVYKDKELKNQIGHSFFLSNERRKDIALGGKYLSLDAMEFDYYFGTQTISKKKMLNEIYIKITYSNGEEIHHLIGIKEKST